MGYRQRPLPKWLYLPGAERLHDQPSCRVLSGGFSTRNILLISLKQRQSGYIIAKSQFDALLMILIDSPIVQQGAHTCVTAADDLISGRNKRTRPIEN